MSYYDCEKIINLKDLDNEDASIFIVTSNRSAGKTTSFLKKMLTNFNEKKEEFILLYRYSYELNSSNEIFKDVLSIYPNLGKDMTLISHARGLFYELRVDNNTCGYALSLSNVDSLKKYSGLFANVTSILMDEFQTESGKYLPKEVQKVQSVLLTVARGGGCQSRNVKLFLLGNNISMMNPYFITFGIHKRLNPNTHFLKGKGWVAEFDFNESAKKAIEENAIFKAFNNSNNKSYMEYATKKGYLKDDKMFIESLTGKNKYLCTIIHDGISYGVREYYEDGFLYVSKKCDKLCKTVLTFKVSDHNQNSIIINRYSWIGKRLKEAFNNGFMRFDDVESKNAIFDILAIDIYD